MTDNSALVDVKPFRELVEKRIADGELTWNNLAIKLGWVKLAGDHHRVKTAFGIKRYISHGRHKYRESIRYDTAVKFCEALGIDPVDMGL